jgi:MFS family permease
MPKGDTGGPDRKGASTARILLASMVGTAVEFYDFYIYGTAASLVFGTLFFSLGDSATRLFASYASFAIAFIARPIGALAFGHFGDRVGRKSTLVVSLLLMGGSTIAIGLLPSYATFGLWAPVLLCGLRFCQGLGLGGEWGGAALLAVENAPPGFAARFGMMPQLGAPIGFIASSGLFLILGLTLSQTEFLQWGWRLPFLFSLPLIALGLWIRRRIVETPAFADATAKATPPKVPLAELLRDFPREVVAGTFAVIACFAVFYLTTTFALGYGTTVLNFDRRLFLELQLAAIPFMAIGTLWAGVWADRTSPRRVLGWGCGGVVVTGGLLSPMLSSGDALTIWAFLSLSLLMMGLVYGPLGAFLPSLFPTRVRYSGISLAFNAGGILGGALAPLLAQSLAASGNLVYVGVYLSGAAALSLAGLATVRRRPSAKAED